MNHILTTLSIIPLLFFSCKKNTIEGDIINNSALAESLRESPESISVGENNLTLSTYLWRDFMPVAEENGSKMMCVNTLVDGDSVAIPSSITLKKQYVIRNSGIWTADYSETKKKSDYELEGSLRNGPKWGPDIEVDVVCEFEQSGITYRVLARSQVIHKTS